MATWPILPGAPIAEAILDIEAVLPKSVTLNDLGKLRDLAGDTFVEQEERVVFSRSSEISGQERHFTSSTKIDGIRFRSPIQGKVVQSRLDGFAFNKLKPYESWPIFSSEARRLWEGYCQITSPRSIQGVSLRYINRIELSMPIKLEEWFTTRPELGPKIPFMVTGFLMRMEIINDKIQAIGIVTQTAQPLEEERAAVILDIEVKKKVDFLLPFKELWPFFEKLRNFKNMIFFNSITDKTMELLK